MPTSAVAYNDRGISADENWRVTGSITGEGGRGHRPFGRSNAGKMSIEDSRVIVVRGSE